MKPLVQNKNQKGAFFWNSAASILVSFQSALLLIVISYFGSTQDAGIFTFAYAAANLMVVIGKFGMRQFQVSDANNKYTFSEYLYSRKITTIIMLIVSFFYALFSGANNYNKIMVILLWCGIRAIEAYEDVYHGFLQKIGYLNKAAKVLFFRTFASIITFSFIYYVYSNLVIASTACFFISLFLALMLNYKYHTLYPNCKNTNKDSIKNILLENMSLFIAYFCTMYLGNAPKYSINNVVSDEMQAIYGYMFMPVFLVNLLFGFILQPLLTTYSAFWHTKNIKELKQLIYRHLMIIVLLTILTILGGKFIGIYLLETIYNVSLRPYEHILYILLFASGLISLLSYSKTLLTVVRCQNALLAGYLATCLFMVIGGRPVLQRTGLTGISIYYTVIISLLNIFSFLLFIHVLHQAEK